MSRGHTAPSRSRLGLRDSRLPFHGPPSLRAADVGIEIGVVAYNVLAVGISPGVSISGRQLDRPAVERTAIFVDAANVLIEPGGGAVRGRLPLLVGPADAVADLTVGLRQIPAQLHGA